MDRARARLTVAGPHPAVAEVRRAVRGLLTPTVVPPAPGGATALIVACSGGADSLALAAAVAFEAPRAGLVAALVTVDHDLQPGSDVQAARVATLGYELGFDPVHTVRVEVGTAGGPEAAARTARYAALETAAAGVPILLGHTLDDQAETVLLGLGRGSGPRSVAGMQPVTDTAGVRYLRPLLGVRRATTEAACAALGLQPWPDPHNDDPAFRRVRLRHEVLPLLEDVLGGGVAPALARTAELLREDLAGLDELASAYLREQAPDPVGDLSLGQLPDLPRAVRTRVLRSWLRQTGVGGLTAAHLAAADALVVDWHGQGPADLPGGRTLRRASGKLVVSPPGTLE